MKIILTTLSALLLLTLVACDNSKSNTEVKSPPSTEVTPPTPKETPPAPVASEDSEEPFQIVDFSEINERIVGDIHTWPKEILYMYYPVDGEEEGNTTTEVEELDLPDGSKKLTLIQDNIGDDALKAIKVVMVVEPMGDEWRVTSLKQNWKCYRGENLNWTNVECL